MSSNEELARRAVAAKGWRWMPGMLATHGMRVTVVDDDAFLSVVWGRSRPSSASMQLLESWLPYLDDPATKGCVRAILAELWGDDVNVYRHVGGFWMAAMADPRGVHDKGLDFFAYTEAEALVMALEAAP
jgi:hypothetical protein